MREGTTFDRRDIFISYVREDEQVAEEIARRLEYAGYTTWYYGRDSLPGLDWLEQVGEVVDACGAVLVVVSLRSVVSDQVDIETEWVRSRKKPVFPVLLGIRYDEIEKQQRTFAMALRRTVAIDVPAEGISEAFLTKLLRGLSLRGVEPTGRGEVEAEPAEVTAPQVDTPAQQVRRTVTVLNCDLTTSTQLDPEVMRKVIARAHDEIRVVVERHGGTVERSIGAAVTAVFGIPRLHEDDALRAVRAALETRDALGPLNEELERDRKLTLTVRIGVDTGEVVAGNASAGQPTVSGDAITVAARLQQAASPGETVIGKATFRLVRDAVRAEPIGNPVTAYRLVELSAGVTGHRPRLYSPMVGRTRQLTQLRQAFDAAVADRTCQLFTVLGEAGVGKSRLVEEFLEGLDGARVLWGRCLPYGEGITYFPVLEIVKQAAGLADFDAPEQIEMKVCSVLEGEEHQELACARLSQLMGAGDVAVPEETLWAIRRFLEAIARGRPLVVVFDDLQWAEATFLDLIEHVADLSRDVPILLACMARPELLELRPGWGGGKPNASTVSLSPLAEEDSELLIGNLLGRAELVEEVRRRISDAAEGNPLFVEEMLSMLIDDGRLVREDGHWTATNDLPDVPVPPTIQALLAARLDHLDPEERAVIERASVVGQLFYEGAVAELCGEEVRQRVREHATSLVRRDLVRPDRSTLPGEDAYRFRHILIRDAAYEGISKELRARLHEGFAGWLERVAGERIAEQEEILGYHLEQAYRYRVELGPADDRARALSARAGEHLAAAGRRAIARGDASGAAKLLERAVALLPRESVERLELLADLCWALFERGDFAKLEEVTNVRVEDASSVGRTDLRAMGRLLLLPLQVVRGSVQQWTRYRPEAEDAIPTFEELGYERGLGYTSFLIALDHEWRYRHQDAAGAYRRAAEHARRAGQRTDEMRYLAWGAASLAWGPLPVREALGRLDELLAEAQGNRYVEGEVLRQRAILEAMSGRPDVARDLVGSSTAIAEELGQRLMRAAGSVSLGWVEMFGGDPVAAERACRRADEQLEALGDVLGRKDVVSLLGAAVCEQGRHEEAERIAAWNRDLGWHPEDVGGQNPWRRTMAKVLARRGEHEEAGRLAGEALALIAPTDCLHEHGDTLMDLAEVLRMAGRADEATEHARAAIALYDRKGVVPSAAKARALLDELSR